MSFGQALSGLNAAAKSLEVTGNNIANSSTVGYKRSRTEFADAYAASLNGAMGAATGIGVNIASITQQFTQGTITATDNPMDIAINGDGFFQVGDGIGPPSYTRSGQFKVVQGRGVESDKRYITDNNGLYLIGIPAGQTTPGPLSLPTGRIPAQQTTQITLELNLDSGDPVLNTPIQSAQDLAISDPANKTIDFSTTQIVYDGKGQQVDVTYYFRKLAAADDQTTDNWAMYVTANGTLVPTPADGEPPAPQAILRFSRQDGGIQDFLNPATPDPPLTSPPPLNIPGTISKTGAAAEAIVGVTMSMGGVTQLSALSGVTKITQDGFASGELMSFAVEGGGTITARYSNGQSAPAGQVQLARFINPQGLRPMGGNLWASTVDSGAPTVNSPGRGGAGDLTQGSLEDSNVDLTAELVNMITSQRAYQANAQTIKTMDQVLQTIVNLR